MPPISINEFFKSYFSQWAVDSEDKLFLDEEWISSCKEYEDLTRVRASFVKKIFFEQFTDANLESVLRDLTSFYDHSLRWTLRQVAEKRGINVGESGVGVFCLGKLGSQEVNLDSDVDLVFLRQSDMPEKDVRQWEQLLGEFNRTLALETKWGHFPKIDLNLRPHGRAGTLLPTVAMAEKFYWHSTDLWNRLAWMRGRFLDGDPRVKEELQDWMPNYVYPKYLDYRLIEHLNDLRNRILEETSQKTSLLGMDVKNGQGGIREIEFCVHGLILLHGGRRPQGRSGNVFEGLRYLSEQSLMNTWDIDLFLRGYSALRVFEHIAQAEKGQQTSLFESKNKKLIQLVLDKYQFSSLKNIMNEMHKIFLRYLAKDQPAKKKEETVQLQDERLKELLAPYLSEKMTQKWTSEARHRFQLLLPKLESTVLTFEDPVKMLGLFLGWVDRLRIRGGYFHILIENPLLLKKLLRVLSLESPLVNDWLMRPRCIENILLGDWDGQTDFATFWEEWKSELSEGETDPDETLEHLRDCRTAFTLEVVSRQISEPERWREFQILWNRVPTTVVQEMLTQMVRKSKLFPLSEPVTLSWVLMGSFGGYTADLYSDLDCLILINDVKPDTKEELVRFLQKNFQGLAVRTARGTLFDVDLRLRPSGSQGPLIVTESYFKKYALNQARLWEWLSWFRGREIAMMDEKGTVKRQSQRFETQILKPLLVSLKNDEKNFTEEDVNQLLETFDQHRKKQPEEAKWAPNGLIETEVRARLKAWDAQSLGHNFETLTQDFLERNEHPIAQSTLWESWHTRLFSTDWPNTTGTKFKKSLRDRLMETETLFRNASPLRK